MSQNVQLNTVMGRNWLRRTLEEGNIIRDCFRLSTGGKEEVLIDQDKIVKIVEDAAKKGGMELKIIRGEGNRQEERILNTGAADSMKLVYFQESSTIKIKRKIIPEGAGKISYKEIVETPRHPSRQPKVLKRSSNVIALPILPEIFEACAISLKKKIEKN